MDNYEFCVQWVLDKGRTDPIRVLDYGCGAGEIVKLLRARNIEAFGCDVYYDAADYSNTMDPALFGTLLRKMEDGRIPFADSAFDFVINNQVMEHVENLDAVLAEISRVLKPGGFVLSLFPDKRVWREGHSGIPFFHWFPKGSRFRVYYALVLRTLGLGYFKEGKPRKKWSEDYCIWLDKWTYYRSRKEIRETFAKHLAELNHIEVYWLHKRLGARRVIAAWLPAVIQRYVVWKLAGLVLEARKAF
ncbi:MAG TPA: class I SAM-dependent methyltransferase [Candidatus Latescibacteria bacterium]|nr:class I SAM-dependent methyltransferase [Candidatus Latescibacterota bacterium]